MDLTDLTSPAKTPARNGKLDYLFWGRALAALFIFIIGFFIARSYVKSKYEPDKYSISYESFDFGKSETEENVCQSSICQSEAENLQKMMDPSIDPCTDFYSFTCGNWIKNKKLISDHESEFMELEVNIALRLMAILEDLRYQDSLPSSTRKTIDFYQACRNADYRSQVGDKELKSDLRKFGGFPLVDKYWNASRFDWADLMVQLFKNGYISNMLFTLHVDIDVKNTSTSLLSVTHPTLSMKKVKFLSSEPDAREYYTALIFSTVDHHFGGCLSDALTCLEEVVDAFTIETKIAQMMGDIDMNNPETFYNIFTLKALQEFAPEIPWRKIITNFLPPGTDIPDDQRIMVTSPSYIKGLNSLLKEIQLENKWKDLANYMLYRVVMNAVNYITVPSLSELSATCYLITLQLFPLPLTSNYVRKHTDAETREVLGKFVEDIRNSLTDAIKDADWLDAKTKSYALFKIEKMKAIIGYDDEVMNEYNLNRYYKEIIITGDHFSNMKEMIAFSLKENMIGLHEKREGLKWFELEGLLLSANAYYMRQANTMVVPAGVLQEKVFAAGKPNYINYGTLGMIVGHELSHGFDSFGSLYDADGNYRKWWTDDTWNLFKNKIKCYEEQYNYYVPDADDYINGTLTLAENIADNGGLKAAYYAYNTAHTRTGSERSLPELNYNNKQLFWIAFASVWCDKETEESLEFDVKHSVHTIAKFRVIGTLSNMKEFSEDFGCKLNSAMNPASKCSLWK